MQMPTVEQIHEFLARHYKRDRFEGRNNEVWGTDYSLCVAKSRHADLLSRGQSLISHHESLSGRAIYFDRRLVALDSPAELQLEPTTDSIVRNAHEIPTHELTLDTPVRIWWRADNEDEVERWRSETTAAGATDFEVVGEDQGPATQSVTNGAHHVLFTVPIRTALANWYDVHSLVDSYLADGSEDHIRSLMAAEGMSER